MTYELSFDELIKVYLFANTPRYLYKHFINQPSLREFAKTHTLDEIRNYLAEQIATEQPTLRERVFAYGALISMALQDPADIEEALEDIDLGRLDWGSEIVVLLKSRGLSSSSTVDKAKPRILKDYRPYSTDAVSSSNSYEVLPLENDET